MGPFLVKTPSGEAVSKPIRALQLAKAWADLYDGPWRIDDSQGLELDWSTDYPKPEMCKPVESWMERHGN